jgi:DNA-binding transcriptional LysR family regulator
VDPGDVSVKRDEWLRVELRHLVALETVATEGSFRGAAEALGYVQSAVSQQVAFLERVVGARLVDRSRGRGKVQLTRSGEIVHAHAAAIIARLDEARTDVTRGACLQRETVRVAVLYALAGDVFPRALTALGDPSVVESVTEVASGSTCLELLCAGEVDVALVGLPVGDGPFAVEPLIESPMALVVARESPLSRRSGPASCCELAATPLILLAQSVGCPCVESWLLAQGCQPDVVCRPRSAVTAQALATHGLGAAVMPRFAIDGLDDGSVVRPVDPRMPSAAIGLVWHRDRGLGRAGDRLRAAMQAQATE